MNTGFYSSTKSQRNRIAKRRLIGLISVIVIIITGVSIVGILTDDGAGYQERADAIAENHELRTRIADLEKENAELQAKLNEAQSPTPEPSPDSDI